MASRNNVQDRDDQVQVILAYKMFNKGSYNQHFGPHNELFKVHLGSKLLRNESQVYAVA